MWLTQALSTALPTSHYIIIKSQKDPLPLYIQIRWSSQPFSLHNTRSSSNQPSNQQSLKFSTEKKKKCGACWGQERALGWRMRRCWMELIRCQCLCMEWTEDQEGTHWILLSQSSTQSSGCRSRSSVASHSLMLMVLLMALGCPVSSLKYQKWIIWWSVTACAMQSWCKLATYTYSNSYYNYWGVG